MNELVTIIVGAIISGLTLYFEYKNKCRADDTQIRLEEIKANSGKITDDEKTIFTVLLRHDLEMMYNKCMDQGFCTEEEYENITETYNLYASLGGNHNGTRMYEKICKLYESGVNI